MKVIDHIKRAEKTSSTLFSCEVTPPEEGGNIDEDMRIVGSLKKYGPSFIHVTSRAADAKYEDLPVGLAKKILEKDSPGTLTKRIVGRDRHGTLGLCVRIQYESKIDAVTHVLCNGFTKKESREFLTDLSYANLKNIFAVQGDERAYKKPSREPVNTYAIDLVKQAKEKDPEFCIGVAGYPERHPAAPNIETDLQYLKQKVDAGADYIITQMFFDNDPYFRFVDMCRAQGINVPIIPGITSLVSKSQIQGKNGIPKKFSLIIPYELSSKIKAANPGDVQNIGIEWAVKQAQGLISQKVPSVHFFIYENAESIIEVVKALGFKQI